MRLPLSRPMVDALIAGSTGVAGAAVLMVPVVALPFTGSPWVVLLVGVPGAVLIAGGLVAAFTKLRPHAAEPSSDFVVHARLTEATMALTELEVRVAEIEALARGQGLERIGMTKRIDRLEQQARDHLIRGHALRDPFREDGS